MNEKVFFSIIILSAKMCILLNNIARRNDKITNAVSMYNISLNSISLCLAFYNCDNLMHSVVTSISMHIF